MTEVVQSPLPTRLAVRSLIESLVGRDVDIKDGDPVLARPTNVIAVYVTDQLAVSALAVVDLEGAARLGGALSMLPKGGVDDAIHEKDLDASLKDNCYEVLNVLAALFNLPDAPHVRLYAMYGPTGAVPADIETLSRTLGNRMDVTMKIAGYGEGKLSLVCK